LWINREQSNVTKKVVAVSYGGDASQPKGDVAMASFPASVQYIQLSYPLIGAGVLRMLNSMLPPSFPIYDELTSARNAYEDVLALPPYFGESLPFMPYVNYYDNFMAPGALPLQYVKRLPDEYIPQLYAKVSVANSGDLEVLYSEAAIFFTSSSPIAVGKPTPSPGVDAPTSTPSSTATTTPTTGNTSAAIHPRCSYTSLLVLAHLVSFVYAVS
jgi:hypothetical protein